MKETETPDLRMSGCNYTIVFVALCLGSGEMRTDRPGPTLKQADWPGERGSYGLRSPEARQACLLAGRILTVFFWGEREAWFCSWSWVFASSEFIQLYIYFVMLSPLVWQFTIWCFEGRNEVNISLSWFFLPSNCLSHLIRLKSYFCTEVFHKGSIWRPSQAAPCPSLPEGHVCVQGALRGIAILAFDFYWNWCCGWKQPFGVARSHKQWKCCLLLFSFCINYLILFYFSLRFLALGFIREMSAFPADSVC